MGVFFKKITDSHAVCDFTYGLTQKTKDCFSLFELVVIKLVIGKLFYSKSTSEYVRILHKLLHAVLYEFLHLNFVLALHVEF
jgi:hypothetical protein